MRIKLVCVGKLKAKAYTQLMEEFLKRLRPYAKIEIIEVRDEKVSPRASLKEEEIVKNKEGEKILSKIKQDEYVVLLDRHGEDISSIELASFIEHSLVQGQSQMTFVIGGALGICESVRTRANKTISFSRLTFTHQLIRVILVEQIYRAFRIINNEPYHK
ncbi:MAG: 23S rRNA (pseudouridine(1915)-N(3))-methyltransferase RlmH [Erysipelotrichaceae bacterium]|nr:23S rRNA (pseudouridine(1915)-N(3))-methyltransferase RlmH [Erysipelotrichaceae bacterium]